MSTLQHLALRWVPVRGDGAHRDEYMVVDTWGECPPIEIENGLTRLWPTYAAAYAFARNIGDRDVGR